MYLLHKLYNISLYMLCDNLCTVTGTVSIRTGDTGGTVNENKDHSTESPRNPQYPNTAAISSSGACVGLSFVPDYGED